MEVRPNQTQMGAAAGSGQSLICSPYDPSFHQPLGNGDEQPVLAHHFCIQNGIDRKQSLLNPSERPIPLISVGRRLEALLEAYYVQALY